MKDELVDALHQPEYTGENRCEACTVVNVVIAAVLGALVARKSRLAGAVTVGVSLILIYLRGYLVPGTPTLTKRYLPPEVLALFGKEPEGPEIHTGLGAIDEPASAVSPERDPEAAPTRTADGSGSDLGETADADGGEAAAGDETDDRTDSAADGPTPEEYFHEYDVVEPCEDADDLCLAEAFESAWFEEIDRIDVEDVGADDVVAAFGIDGLAGGNERSDDATGHEFEIRRFGDARQLRRDDGAVVGKWPSQAALVADLTATRVLAERDPAWESYPPATKGQLLNNLRLFLETCPTSGGRVVMDGETRQSCCSSYDVVAVVCEDTDERLFEQRVDGIEA